MENIFNIIKEKDTDLLCKFLERYPQGLERKNEEEIWALHKVMEQGTLEMVQYVVEYTNANLNFKDKVGNTGSWNVTFSGSSFLLSSKMIVSFGFR